ncbi:MAG TPA: ATP-binding protein [Armatimonadota bacterium]|jgi:signal transduction histidine kinase
MARGRLGRNLESDLIGQADKIRLVLIGFLATIVLATGSGMVERPLLAYLALALAAGLTAVSRFALRWDRILARRDLLLAVLAVMLLDVTWLLLFVLASGGFTSPFWPLLILPVIFSAIFYSGAGQVLPLMTLLVMALYLLLLPAAGPVTSAGVWETMTRLMFTIVVAWFVWALAAGLEGERRSTQRLLSHLTEGVLLTNADGCVLLVNPEMARMCGLRVEDMVGSSALEAEAPVGFAMMQRMTEGVRERPAGCLTRDIVLKGRHMTNLRCHTVPCGTDQGRPAGWLVVAMDISDFECQSRVTEQRLEVLATELKSPMAYVETVARVLQELAEELDTGEQLAALHTLRSEKDRLSRLVYDLLDSSQLEQPEYPLSKEDVDCAELAIAVRELFEEEAEAKGVELVCDIPPFLPPVLGDFRRLVQLLSNLVDNAVEYTPPGGRVTISAGAGSFRGEIVVSDTGPGISPEFHEQIFERFSRGAGGSTEGRAGLGMGLYVARQLARKHGGEVLVESARNVGSIFTVLLPLARCAEVKGSLAAAVRGVMVQ